MYSTRVVCQHCAWAVDLQQLLHYDVTTHCCETLAQTLAMWWASSALIFRDFVPRLELMTLFRDFLGSF